MMNELHSANFRKYPVIAAIRGPEDFARALSGDVRVISVVGGNIFQMTDQLLQAKEEKKTVLFHMDLVEGIGRDKAGMHYAKETFGIAGIHSTRSHIIKLAKAEDLITIHRLFITDFQSITSGLSMVKISNPDFVEVTPGVLPRSVNTISRSQGKRVIASGLVQSEKDIQILLRAGASNMVCSSQSLWFRENVSMKKDHK